jgi:hypothetical protein
MADLPPNYRNLQRALQPPSVVFRDWHHDRYHNAQADPKCETAAKNSARRAGHKVVKCPCGQEFPV